MTFPIGTRVTVSLGGHVRRARVVSKVSDTSAYVVCPSPRKGDVHPGRRITIAGRELQPNNNSSTDKKR